MTAFVRPSTVTGLTSPYGYKGGLPSPAQDYIDINFPNILNKTGDTITGTITLASTAILNFATGSLLEGNLEWANSVVNPTLYQQTPATDTAPNNISLQSADAFSGAVTNVNGGNLTIGTGNAASGGVAGTLQLNIGHGGSASQILFASPTEVVISNGASTALELFSSSITPVLPISYRFDVAAPGLSQGSTAAASATGTTMTIAAQSCTGTTSVGGSLVLQTGAGTTNPGLFLFDAGSTNIGTLATTLFQVFPAYGNSGYTINNWAGTRHTQAAQYTEYRELIQTAATGSPIPINLNINSETAAVVEVTWVRRAALGTSPLGNKAMMVIICNGSGVILSGYTLTNLVSPSGNFDDCATAFTVSSSTNTLTLGVNQIAAEDWDIKITIQYN